MMRRKSPRSELLLDIIKSNKYSSFYKEFVKGDNFIFLPKYYFVLVLQVYFNKTQQNKSLFLNNIEICHSGLCGSSCYNNSADVVYINLIF